MNISDNNIRNNITRRYKTANQAADLLNMQGRIPPQAVDFEEVVLGAMMLEKDAVNSVIDLLNPEVFYKEAHQTIFSAIKELFTKSEPIDILTVTNQLKTMGELESVGGAYYISQLTNRVVSAANIEYHARIILQKYIQRQLILISSETIKDAYEDTTDVFDLLDNAENKLFQISENILKKSHDKMPDLVKLAISEIEAAKNSNSSLRGVPSGYTELDRITQGWQKSDLIILAARPSMGKTAFALKRLDYLESIFSDDALIITGRVVRRANVENRIQGSAEYVEYNRQTKAEYINNLRYSFGSKEYINIRFSNMEILKMGKGDSIYSIQIKQDYYSSNYGDTGYLFLLVDASDYKRPVIHVRTWQPKPDPEFGIFGPYNF